MRAINVIDSGSEGETLAPAYRRAKRLLSEHGVSASFSTSLTLAGHTECPMLILDDAPHCVNGGRAVTGMRTLNRADRLLVLQCAGVPTVPWSSPRSTHELRKQLSLWSSSSAVLKYDCSGDRSHVRVIDAGDRLPPLFEPTHDIVMQRTYGPPQTLKVYVFYDIVLCSGRMNTLPVDHHRFADRELTFEFCRTPATVRAACLRAAKEFAHYGVGMFSVDFMLHRGHWHAIEANTHGASRALIFEDARWSTVARFANACSRWARTRSACRTLNDHLAAATRLRSVHERRKPV
jgi:hypothetical protein